MYIFVLLYIPKVYYTLLPFFRMYITVLLNQWIHRIFVHRIITKSSVLKKNIDLNEKKTGFIRSFSIYPK